MFRRESPACAGLFFVLTFALNPAQHTQVELRSFIEAFTPLVIKAEKTKRNYRWDAKNHDCAGLVRYLFWEATQRHDERFYTTYPEMSMTPLESRAAPRVVLGNTAADLIKNSRPLGRRTLVNDWQTGDLLYFYAAELKIRHVMLVIRMQRKIYLVYHTGDARGELRIRTVEDLMNLPESQWHIDVANPVFQGVFRPYFLA